MAAFLAQGCAEGRLSADELSARVEAAYRAVTYADLAALASDLPVTPVGRPAKRLRPAVLIPLVSTLILLALPTYALIEVLSSSPVIGMLAILVAVVLVIALVATLVSAAVTLAPVVALGLGAVWLGRRLGGGDELRTE